MLGVQSVWGFSPLGIAQWRALNEDGVAVVAEAPQEGFGHGSVAEEVGPFVIDEIGCNDCGVAPVTFLHQFEEDVGLLGSNVMSFGGRQDRQVLGIYWGGICADFRQW